MNNLLEISNCRPVELDVFEFFKIISSDNNQNQRNLFKNKFLKEIRFSFEKGKTPVLFTSRKFLLDFGWFWHRFWDVLRWIFFEGFAECLGHRFWKLFGYGGVDFENLKISEIVLSLKRGIDFRGFEV